MSGFALLQFRDCSQSLLIPLPRTESFSSIAFRQSPFEMPPPLIKREPGYCVGKILQRNKTKIQEDPKLAFCIPNWAVLVSCQSKSKTPSLERHWNFDIENYWSLSSCSFRASSKFHSIFCQKVWRLQKQAANLIKQLLKYHAEITFYALYDQFVNDQVAFKKLTNWFS